jgi:hypothetical protein
VCYHPILKNLIFNFFFFFFFFFEEWSCLAGLPGGSTSTE